MPRVLLIDDDVELCEMLADYLVAEGFEVEAVHDGIEGAQRAAAGDSDVIVLDVMLPRINGLEVLRRIRHDNQVPVLMLTAKGDDVDRIVGLELGADDYLPKPCNPRELVARLRAILRRAATAPGAAAQPEVVQVGELSLRPAERIAEWRGEAMELTSTEFNVLEVLMHNAGRVVSKAELSEQALGRPLSRYDRSIDMHVSNLRQKLGVLDDGRSPIQTVRGQGYQLVKG
jgi:two-component system OmpR family response regulator